MPWGKKPVRPRVLGENRAMAEELHKAIAASKLMSPPTNCLSPIGDELMKKGLVSFLNVIESEGESGDENAQLDLDAAAMKPGKKAAKAAKRPRSASKAAEPPPRRQPIPDAPPEEGVEKIKGHNYFIATVTRPPKVYRGNPFQVEVGLAYGGSWPADKTIELFRFANRVPLLFQRGACGITEGIVRTDWRNYLLSQPKGSLPVGPMALLVHIASVWVPFTSESKEAVAHYPDILKEIQLAAQECGRKLATFIRKGKALDYQAQRRSIFELYIEEVATAIGKITGRKPGPIKREFLQVAHKVTAAEMKEEEKAAELEAREAKQKAKARRRRRSSRDASASGRRFVVPQEHHGRADPARLALRVLEPAVHQQHGHPGAVRPVEGAHEGLDVLLARQLLLHGLARRVLHDHELPDRPPHDLRDRVSEDLQLLGVDAADGAGGVELVHGHAGRRTAERLLETDRCPALRPGRACPGRPEGRRPSPPATPWACQAPLPAPRTLRPDGGRRREGAVRAKRRTVLCGTGTVNRVRVRSHEAGEDPEGRR